VNATYNALTDLRPTRCPNAVPTVTHCLSDAELSAFYDGSLRTEDHLRAAQHLRTCVACEARAGDRPLPSRPLFPEAPAPHDVTVGVGETVHRGATAAVGPVAGTIGPYRIGQLIGRGGMGSVYEAVHDGLGRTVALKVLPQLNARNASHLERFKREARTVGQLNHPNVVMATDSGEAGGVHFLAMELVDGVDVARLVRAVGPLPVSDSAEMVRQAAVGLAHAHAKGIVHRDVKPSNLMVTTVGEVKILDLGLALSRESEVGPDGPPSGPTLLGTHDYMAPEQWADSSTVGPPADVYGLGCVLFQALAGKPPFVGLKLSSPRAKQYAHQNHPPPEVPNRGDVPPALAWLLNRMLAKSPDERPSAAEVASALKRFVGVIQLSRLVERAQLAPVSGFSDGDPTNAAPLLADSSMKGSSVVLAAPKPPTVPDMPAHRDPAPRPSRSIFYFVLGLVLFGGGILVWAVARFLRGHA